MRIQDVDRRVLLNLLKTVIPHEPELLRMALREVLSERTLLRGEDSPEHQALVSKMIDADFDRFDDVFRALVDLKQTK